VRKRKRKRKRMVRTRRRGKGEKVELDDVNGDGKGFAQLFPTAKQHPSPLDRLSLYLPPDPCGINSLR
jgi:hypothetical protein